MSIEERLERLIERHEALATSLELLSHELQDLKETARRDGENIRALARIAEIHERRLADFQGGAE